MAYQGESFIHRYGKKAALAAPPVKRMLELGIPVGLGTDGTRVASYNPWIALYWITTGKTIGGTQVMAKENTMDRMTALKIDDNRRLFINKRTHQRENSKRIIMLILLFLIKIISLFRMKK